MSGLREMRYFLVAGALLAAALTARASEQVTLTNGFDLICDHRQVVGDKVRLYTAPDDRSFIEISARQIAAVESLPADAAPRVEELTVPDLKTLIAHAGAEHNLDVDLLASVVRAESGGRVRAVSHAGAQGLMQLMPATASQLGVTDSFRPDQNIDGGTKYLDALLVRYHDNLALALAAYNAGPAAVDKYRGVPPYRETQLYVARVIREFNRRKLASR